jgi:hypothetical protein
MRTSVWGICVVEEVLESAAGLQSGFLRRFAVDHICVIECRGLNAMRCMLTKDDNERMMVT